VKRGEQIDLTLQAGFVLAVTCDANTSASVARLGDSPGLPPSSPTAAAAGTTTKFGPFSVPTRFTIYGLTGNGVLTYAMAAPPQLASMRIIAVIPDARERPRSDRSGAKSFSVPGASVLDVICDVGGNTGNSTGIVGRSRHGGGYRRSEVRQSHGRQPNPRCRRV
jgi:hypothetical protein